MLPSEELRMQIENKYGIDLEKYRWSEEFFSQICSINLDTSCEDNIFSMKEVYERGLNIGKCGLTSRYVARMFDNAELNYGICDILVGTPSCENGKHAWIALNGYLVDTTLMIMVPIDNIEKLGYTTSKIINHDSARELSEYDTYSNYSKVKKL